MRGMISLVVIIVLLSQTVAFAQSDNSSIEPPDVFEYIVTADKANLRSGAGTSFDIVTSVVKGDSLLIYVETPATSGWLRVYRPGEDDAYIADYLVEKAPMRFYPVNQPAIVTVSGRGKGISDIYEVPEGLYRIDAVVQDRSFILHVIGVEGDCPDDNLLNELNFDSRTLVISTLFISKGCSVIFETDNVSGDWQIELRNLLEPDFFIESLLDIENGTAIASNGHVFTMGTILDPGIWTVSANVSAEAFILHAHVLSGECDDTSVFNELDFNAKTLEVSTVYKNNGSESCIVYWETSNVRGDWSLTFEKLR